MNQRFCIASQGRLCAATLQRLKNNGVKWDSVYYSTMLRTAFQADVIKKALDDQDVVWKVFPIGFYLERSIKWMSVTNFVETNYLRGETS